MIDQASWSRAVHVLRQGMSTSLHCSIASVNEDGTAHVTPIGSLQITGPSTAMFFDVFGSRLSRNVDRDSRVTILAVNSSKLFWLKMFIKGRFVEYPGVRLIGTVSPKRESTPQERERFERRVKRVRRMRGYDVLWSNIGHARDIKFTTLKYVRIGRSTSHLGR
ncbi:hypothetical protein BMS3Bbin02_01439 [bacterium BMS3Bbin02]|nr:hypothetical protein BMS3Bbin02_01439 [bacterium BMS3Bbin02]